MNLVSKISDLTHLSQEASEWLQSNLVEMTFKKNEEVLRSGKVCSHLYFVTSGMLCGYYIQEGKEICNWLASEGDFGTSYYSFISRQPSYEIIQSIEESTVQAISFEKINELYGLFPETERAGRLILEEYYRRLEERIISVQFKSAKERYQNLFNTRPELIKRAPLGRIASYLGITQETLSRIRAEV